MLERGIADGAKLVARGGIPPHLSEGFYLQPTVFLRCRSQIGTQQGEVFGPIAVIRHFMDEVDTHRSANYIQFGLEAFTT